MRTMRAPVVVVLVLLLVVLATAMSWWGRAGSDLAPGVDGGPEPTIEGHVADSAPDRGSAPGRTTAGSDDVAIAPPTPAVAAPVPPPTGRLVVKVRNERGDALAGCEVHAGENAATSDRLGDAAFEVPAARTFVAVAPPVGVPLVGRNGWQNVLAGGTTELVVVLVAAAATPFWCRFVGAEDERALAGVGLLEQPGGRPLRSDAEGFVQLVPGDQNVFLDVAVAGRAPCRVIPTAAHATREQALRVALAVGVRLAVQVGDAAGSPVAGVALELTAPAYALQQPELQGARGPAFVWRATSDAAGSLVTTDLPVGVALTATVTAPSPHASLPPERWVIAAGEARRTITLPGAGSVRGHVLDAAGSPVDDAVVQAIPATADEVPRTLPTVAAPRTTKSARDGAFEFVGLAAGRYWVGLGATGSRAPVVQAVEVAIGRSADVELRVRDGLVVAGIASGPDGSPCRGVDVEVYVDGRFFVGAASDAAGRFRFANVPPGACELDTGEFVGDLGLPTRMRVEAGNDAVELRLVPIAGSIAGRCVGGDDAWVTATRRGGGVIGTRCDLDGTFRYPGLRAGTWDVAAFDRRGNVAWSAAIPVLPGRATAGVLLDLQAGAVLRPRHARADEYSVQRGDDVVAFDNLEPDVPGHAPVPAGRWTVVFRSQGREVGRREVTVRAGEHSVVDGGS